MEANRPDEPDDDDDYDPEEHALFRFDRPTPDAIRTIGELAETHCTFREGGGQPLLAPNRTIRGPLAEVLSEIASVLLPEHETFIREDSQYGLRIRYVVGPSLPDGNGLMITTIISGPRPGRIAVFSELKKCGPDAWVFYDNQTE